MDSRRALGALSFEEEKHLIWTNSQLVLEAACRVRQLTSNAADPAEVRSASTKHTTILEDLRHNICLLASQEALADQETILAVLQIPQFRRDPAVVLRIHEAWPGVLEHAANEVLRSRDAMLKAVARHGWSLEFASQELRNDKEVVLAAVMSEAWSLEFASDALLADRQVVLAAIRSQTFADVAEHGCMLSLIDRQLLADKEVVIAAAGACCWCIAEARRELRSDRDVLLAALAQQTREAVVATKANVFALAEGALREDREVVLQALKVDGGVLCHVGWQLLQDKDFLLEAMHAVPLEDRHLAYMSVPDDVLEDLRGACESGLALAGEEGPVVTVSLHPPNTNNDGLTSFDATLLSGASFACQLPTEATVAELTQLVLGELEAYVGTRPMWVFILFSRSTGDVVAVSPWEWYRPVSEFR